MVAAGVADAIESFRPLVEKMAGEPLDPDEAVELVELGVELERLAVAMRLTAARAVRPIATAPYACRPASRPTKAASSSPKSTPVAATMCAMQRLAAGSRPPKPTGGKPSLGNLARLCAYHHYLTPHLGYRYRGGPGTWQWIPPEDPPPPERPPG